MARALRACQGGRSLRASRKEGGASPVEDLSGGRLALSARGSLKLGKFARVRGLLLG